MATYYINADTGNDTTGTGASGSPWATLSKAHASATSGDTVHCQTSTANYTFGNQTISKSLTIRGDSATSPAVFSASAAVRQWTITASLTIEYVKFADISLSAIFTGIFKIGASVDIEFYCCRFDTLILFGHGSTGGGTLVYAEAGGISVDILFDACSFRNITNASATSRRCVFNIYGNDGKVLNIDVRGCTWHFGNSGIEAIWSSTAGHTSAVNVVITNSIFVNASATTMYISDPSNPVDSMIVSYSCIRSYTSAPSGTGNITSDPLFVDAANGNFNLRPTSPAISAGTLV